MRYCQVFRETEEGLKTEKPWRTRHRGFSDKERRGTLLTNDNGFRGISQAELKQAWGGFLTELGDRAGGWDWWATLTFREPPSTSPTWTKIGWGYSGRAWDTFTRELGLRKGMHDIRWVRGREYQHWRGVPHFHGLIGGVANERRLTMMDWWFQRYGIARIEPYDRSLGAGYYLCKYVVKELGDIQFSKGLTLKT